MLRHVASAALLALVFAGTGTAGAASMVAKNFVFAPDELSVSPGEVVTVLVEGEGHTVTANDGAFDTGLVQGGGSTSFIAPNATGTFLFFCALHATGREPQGTAMVGMLTVVAAADAPPAATPGGSVLGVVLGGIMAALLARSRRA